MYTVQLTKRVHQTLSWIHWIIVTKNKYCVIFARNWVLLTILPLNEIHTTETNIISTIFHRSLSILLYLCYASAYLVLNYTMLYVNIRIETFDVRLVLSSFLFCHRKVSNVYLFTVEMFMFSSLMNQSCVLCIQPL